MDTIKPCLTIEAWVALPGAVREKMKEIFKINRSSGAVVLDNRVQTDGYTLDDLKVVNVESMQHFLKSKDQDFFILLDKTVGKIKDSLMKMSAAPVEPSDSEIHIKSLVSELQGVRRRAEYLGVLDEVKKQLSVIFEIKPNAKTQK